MCVITDMNHIVVSISLIRGVGDIPFGYHVYEYVKDTPDFGSFYQPKEA